MSKIPTAKEFSIDIEFVTEHDLVLFNNIYQYAIDFAKMHVKEALKSASESRDTTMLTKDSILNAYNLNNIK